MIIHLNLLLHDYLNSNLALTLRRIENKGFLLLIKLLKKQRSFRLLEIEQINTKKAEKEQEKRSIKRFFVGISKCKVRVAQFLQKCVQ